MITTKTILCVDDEPDNLKLLQQILKNDYQLMFAIDGEKAIAAAQSKRPDLILLDGRMPIMDGFEVCEMLKASPETRNIPIMFVTALTDKADRERGIAVGAVDFIYKPISALDLKTRVSSYLDSD